MDWKEILGPPPTKVTQSTYWGGSQLSYTMYLILTIIPFTGLIGIDHFALRSPMTGILKILSIIPLFGFWYFYDIAQACGEQELILKHGIGIPLYGPTGIGKGIFNDPSMPEVNPNFVQAGGADVAVTSVTAGLPVTPVAAGPPVTSVTAGLPVTSVTAGLSLPNGQSEQNTLKHLSPFMFALYCITTLIFFFLPINKFIAGDYELGILNIILLIIFPLVVIQGLYDIYNLIFNTKSLFETGIARIPGVSFLLGFFKIGLGALTGIATGVATGAALGAAEEYNIKGIDPKNGLSGVLTKLEKELPLQLGKEAAQTGIKAKHVAVGQLAVASGAINAVKNTSGAVSAVSKAISEDVTKDPRGALALLGASPTSTQKGGGIQLIPSVPVLLFTVGLVAFSGYVFYVYKNTFKKPEKSDDPPREPRAVREPFKSGK